MRLLALSDLHNDFGAFAVHRLPDADMALVAGDLTEIGFDDPPSVARASRWMEALTERYQWVFYVLGNHDLRLLDTAFDRPPDKRPPWCLSIARRVVERDRFRFVGASLSPCFDLPELERFWDRMTARPEVDREYFASLPPADIMLSHCPPFGILDEWKEKGSGRHIGSPGLTAYLERYAPRVVVCGHIHEGAGSHVLGSTLVVNCAGRAVVIRLDEDGTTRVE